MGSGIGQRASGIGQRAAGIGQLAAVVVALTAACKPPISVTPAPATASAELTALTGAAVVIAAGDIGSCDSNGDELTARTVDSILRVDSIAGVEDVVITVGDNAYPNANERDFANCFRPSWGDTTKSIMRHIRPTPGNHEHRTERAAPYYRFFGRAAGDPGKGYYAYDHGAWRMIALNSEILVNADFGPRDREEQQSWLEDELESNRKRCTLAYFHHPRWSSGWHGSDVRMDNLYRALYEGGADVVLTGHDHHYERFLPLDPSGQLDTARGLVSFVLGTGGIELRGINRPQSYSAARVLGRWGVLKMTLGREEYQWAFIEPGGRVWDPGHARCH